MANERTDVYPVGIQSFEYIRKNGLLYVDKTDYIRRLMQLGTKSFFLSRPRRFGKSLFISTLQAFLKGRRELFSGLAIDDAPVGWRQTPVIRLDMSMVKPTTAEELTVQLGDILSDLERQFMKGERLAESLGGRLQALIKYAASNHGGSVAVLVDEYDSPLLNVANDPVMLDRFRQIMRGFYSPIKTCDDDLRFVFFSGITKFSQLSIFSELNNLRDISMEPEFAGICGITEDELRCQLKPDVERFADRLGKTPEEMYSLLKGQYDGYHFSRVSPDIYNPYSLLSAFAKEQIGSWWFATGTPASLIDLVRNQGWQISDLERFDALESDFDIPTESMDTPLPMLYQAGYLTIKTYDEESRVYTLGIPNTEVSRGLSEGLVRAADPGAALSHNSFLIKLARDLRAGELNRALERLRAYLAGIPYHLGSRDERGFQTKFYLVFDLLGIQISTEFQTATGRVDAVVRARDITYVFEFKYDGSAEAALAQIDDKGYLVPFSACEGRVIKIGVNFDSATQTIGDWIVQES